MAQPNENTPPASEQCRLDAAAKPSRVIKDPMRYKTVMCNKFEKSGKCPYGPRCQFAHGLAELRRRPTTNAATSADSPAECTSPRTSVEMTPPLCAMDVDEVPTDLALHELTGQVLCRRDASHTTLSIRRTISFLFDEGDNGFPTDQARGWQPSLMEAC